MPVSWYFKLKELLLADSFKNKTHIKDFDVKGLLFSFLNRTRFAYKMGVLRTYFFKCFCLRNLNKNRNLADYK